MEAQKLKDEFDEFTIGHIKREDNARADMLANMGIDSALDKSIKRIRRNLTPERNK